MKAVDLGLSVLWADMNVGAGQPESYGDFFAWGEVEAKLKYDFGSYIFADGDIWEPHFKKYNEIDNSYSLSENDDAASMILQLDWRMPSRTDFEELFSKCNQEWDCRNGICGYYFVGPNGNRIFMPAAGYMEKSIHRHLGVSGLYWTSELVSHDKSMAWQFLARSNTFTLEKLGRHLGCCIRAVCDFPKEDNTNVFDLITFHEI